MYAGNKCLYILRSLRKEGLSQDEIDTLFNAKYYRKYYMDSRYMDLPSLI